MIDKIADFSFASVDSIESSGGSLFRTASSKKGIEEDARNIIAAEMKKHKNSLFFRAKAIEANVPNNNGDSFSSEELKKSYQSFVGVPFFTNHDNQNIERAKGKIVWSEWVDDENSIYVVAFVDRDAYPHLCRGIEQQYMTGVSMGASVGYSECSLCGNKASTVDEYCSHIKNFKGRKFTGTVKNVKTGKTVDIKNQLVFEHNYDIRFIELSGVADPACSSCRIDQIYNNKDFSCDERDKKSASSSYDSLIKAASSCYNDVSILKVASLEKKASQKDIDQLNQCLSAIEQVSVKLIENRANVEMEFASDLVEILAELQDFVDELVQAGYGQLPEAAGKAIPGVAPEQSGDANAQQAAVEQQPTQPISSEEELSNDNAEPGKTNVEEPLVQAPVAPSALEEFKEATRPAAKSKLVSPIRPVRSQSEEDMRRMPNKSANNRERTKEVLADDWKEKLQVLSMNLKESINNDIMTSGGQNMSKSMSVEAKSKNVDLHETKEGQLESVRTGKEAEVTTEVQLENKRSNKSVEVTTEKQLEKGDLPRSGKDLEVITEKQLEKGELSRTDKDSDSITESQLENDRTNKVSDVTTEKQLEKTPWARVASSAFQKHVEASADILAKTVVASGSTPEQVIKAACSFVGGEPSSKLAFAYEMWNNKNNVEDIVSVASKNSYWGKKGVKLASSGSLRDILVSYASDSIKKNNLNPECIVECFPAIVAHKAQSMVESKVNEIVTKASSVTVDTEPSMSEQINSFFESKTKEAKSTESKVALADHVIETSLKEMGVSASADEKTIKREASIFAKSACRQYGLKLASLVNVTVDGEVVTIAVETDGGESVEIPIGNDKKSVKEDDDSMTDLSEDEEIESATPTPPPASTAAPATTPSTVAPAAGSSAPGKVTGDDILGLASSKKQVKKAQFGGGSPAVPNAGAGAAAPESTSAMAPASMPEEGGVQTLTEDVSAEEKLPVNEQQMAGTVCPICGSNDTETGRKDQVPGQFDCNNCGSKYTLHVNVEILNPQDLFSGVKNEELEEPELPEMPVAASVKVDKTVFGKIVKAFSDGKVACPGCGHEQSATGEPSSHTVKCASCSTECKRDLIIDTDSPENVQLMVEWNLKASSRKCSSCNKSRKTFANDLAFGKMVKSASKASFPVEKAKSWITKNYGSDAVVTYGPAKGHKLAETVTKQLSTFGLDKVKYMKRLCEVQTKADPMDECIKMQQRQIGASEERAKKICECIKERFKTEEDENVFMEAFAGMFSKGIMRRMASHNDQFVKKSSENEDYKETDDLDISSLEDEEPKTNKYRKYVTKWTPSGKEMVFEMDVEPTNETKMANPSEVNLEMKVESIHKDGASLYRGYKWIVDDSLGGDESTNKMASSVKKACDEVKIKTDKLKTRKLVKKLLQEEAKDEKAIPKNSEKKSDESPEIPAAKNEGYIGDEKEAAPKSTDEVVIPVNVQYLGEEENKGDINTSVTGNVLASSDDNKIVVDSKSDNEKNEDDKNDKESSSKNEDNKNDKEENNELEEHRNKISVARRDKAAKIAGMMLGNGSITSSEYDDMIETLAILPLDKQETLASKMASSSKAVKTASSLSMPVIIEDKGMVKETTEKSLSEKISSHFTIGGRSSDRYFKDGLVE